MVVDLKKPEGKALLFKLYEKADVVLENFRVDALERPRLRGGAQTQSRHHLLLGVGLRPGRPLPRTRRTRPQGCPAWSAAPAENPHLHGVRCGVSIADLAAGMNAAYGVMLALRMKERHRRRPARRRLDDGRPARAAVHHHRQLFRQRRIAEAGTPYLVVPYQTFQTKRATWRSPSAGQKLWKIFCPVIGAPELTDDPLYATVPLRMKNRDTLAEAAGDLPHQIVRGVGKAAARKQRAGRRRASNIAQVVEHPQVKARGVLIETDHPKAGKVDIALRLPNMPPMPDTPAPLRGQHTSIARSAENERRRTSR